MEVWRKSTEVPVKSLPGNEIYKFWAKFDDLERHFIKVAVIVAVLFGIPTEARQTVMEATVPESRPGAARTKAASWALGRHPYALHRLLFIDDPHRPVGLWTI